MRIQRWKLSCLAGVFLGLVTTTSVRAQRDEQASGASGESELPRKGSIWALGTLDTGLQWLSTELSGEVNKTGYHAGIGAVASFYREQWVTDVGMGWRYSSLAKGVKRIYTQSGIFEVGERYRMGAWQIGPHVKLAFGDDMTFTESVTVNGNVLILAGLQLHRDLPGRNWLSRLGLRLHTDVNLKSQQIFMSTLVFEFGVPLVKGRGKEVPLEVPQVELPPEPEMPMEMPVALPDVQAAVTGAKQVTLRLSDKILFDTGMSHLKKSSQKFLGELAKLLQLKSQDWDTTEITGHADIRGKESVNKVLSEARARSVNNYLRNQGIAAVRMSYSGKGELEPLDPAQNLQAYAKNRRVELKFEGVDDANQFVTDVESLQY